MRRELWCFCAGAVFSCQAASAGQTVDAIGLITDAADRMCGLAAHLPSKDVADLQGSLRAELSTLFVALGKIGITRGTCEFAALQERLTGLVLGAHECNRSVFDALERGLIPQDNSAQPAGEPDVKNARTPISAVPVCKPP
jgi:hypothetical protein